MTRAELMRHALSQALRDSICEMKEAAICGGAR
jgi:hypothetical protein